MYDLLKKISQVAMLYESVNISKNSYFGVFSTFRILTHFLQKPISVAKKELLN